MTLQVLVSVALGISVKEQLLGREIGNETQYIAFQSKGAYRAERAGKQGNDGYFDVKCFDQVASACGEYLKAGREVGIDGRLVFEEFETQGGGYASRVYIVAQSVEFLASRARKTGQADSERSPEQPAAVSSGRSGDAAA